MANFNEIIKKYVAEDGSIPASAIGQLESAIKTTVGNEFVDKERYKSKLTEIESLKEQKQTAEDNATTAEKWKTKYDELKSDFDTYKKDVSAKETRTTKADAFKGLLKEIGIPDKRFDRIVGVSTKEIDELEIVDGKIKNADKLKESIKSEWADFIVTTSQQGANTSNPPDNNNGGVDYNEMSDEDYYRMMAEKNKK